jgi:hypothetical protein
MSVYGIEVPELNRIDTLAEQHEARDERTRARMGRKAMRDRIVEGLLDAIDEHGNPVSDAEELFWSAPARDQYDLRAICEMRGDSTRRLGQTLLRIIAEASLHEYEDADNEGF